MENIYYYNCDNIAAFSAFYVGGEYIKTENGTFMQGQMYTEVYIPKNKTKKYPVVLMHGNWRTGHAWKQTADGKKGWLGRFLDEGYTVYIIDQPARGRSISIAEIEGPRMDISFENAVASFINGPKGYSYEAKHTQWPDECGPDTDNFRQYYSTQVESLYSPTSGQENFRKASRALFKVTGPCILVGHSQAGPFTWIAAHDYPEMVKAYVALEPQGPAFVYDDKSKPYVDEDGNPLNWGVRQVPLEFDPPISSSKELKIADLLSPDSDHINGFIQAEPARKIPRLAKTKGLMVTAEASYHTPYDWILRKALQQAGADLKYTYLNEVGIYGNGHYMFLEKNSGEVFEFVNNWIVENTEE